MTPAELEAHAERVAASLPPLTDEQRSRLAALLAPALTDASSVNRRLSEARDADEAA